MRGHTRHRHLTLVGLVLAVGGGAACSLLLDFSSDTCYPEPEFAGTWAGDGVRLVIGHETVPFECLSGGGEPTPPGHSLVFVHGFDETAGVPWDLMAVSGQTVDTGVAEASGRLWRRQGESLFQVGNPTVRLVRFGDAMTLSLDYTTGGVVRDEDFDLIKVSP